MPIKPTTLLSTVDLGATFVFAIEGAAAAAAAGLDLFGVLVVAFATSLAGGIVRDLLLGEAPPEALRSVRYPVTAFAGGAVVIVVYQLVNSISSWIITGLDAVGLSLFAVAGAAKALNHRSTALTAIMLGTITAVGGGVVRDILLNEVPVVLRANIYAVAALTGAAVLVGADRLRWPRVWSMSLGAAVCFLLRILSASQHWNLPRVNA